MASRINVYINRFCLILTAVIAAALVVFESLSVSGFFPKHSLWQYTAMGLGTLLWVALVVYLWKASQERFGTLWFMVLFVLMTTISLSGFFVPVLFKPALWINLFVPAGVLFQAIYALIENWRQGGLPQMPEL